jgi:dynein heavy chain
VDVTSEILALAAEKQMSESFVSISLGQGQEMIAENAVRRAWQDGTWVMLQNCHLLASFLPEMEKLIDQTPKTVNENYRLWLSSMPDPEFPVSVLQNSIKLTNEPPKGMKANLQGSLASVEHEWFEEHETNKLQLSRLHFALSFFHATVQERKKFGPMGWNRVYEFNASDLKISRTQLKMFVQELGYDEVPYQTLHYLIGQLNYGGRVTDDWDRRCMMNVLEGIFSDDVFQIGQKFDPAGQYVCPFPPEDNENDLDFFRQYAASLPDSDNAAVFGLHENVNIVTSIAESAAYLDTLIQISPSDSGGAGGGKEAALAALCNDIEEKVPDVFDIEDAQRRYPVVYTQSMNTVLVQECMRYNKLIRIIKQTTDNIKAAVRGDIPMTPDLEVAGDDIFNGKVPRVWRLYRTMKPLAAWVIDVVKRIESLNKWLAEGTPSVYWISGFFFTQSFLTGTLQNYARSHTIPIDQLAFDFEVMDPNVVGEDHKSPPKDGCFVTGLFMAGARWNKDERVIADSFNRVLYDKMPVIHLKPIIEAEIPTDRAEYVCPVYNTSERRGTLTTTGVSDNYVVAIKLPSNHPESHWVRRAVACLCQLDF